MQKTKRRIDWAIEMLEEDRFSVDGIDRYMFSTKH